MTDLKLGSASRLHQSVRQVLAFCRTHIRSMIKSAAFVILVVELGGIWNELHHVRTEQVKNAWYALSPEVKQRIPARYIRKWESTSDVEGNVTVDGSVSIDGDVNLDEPVEVEITR